MGGGWGERGGRVREGWGEGGGRVGEEWGAVKEGGLSTTL